MIDESKYYLDGKRKPFVASWTQKRGFKRVSFRIRKIYFDLIVNGEKKQEIRTDKPYWSWLLGDDPPRIATFICGKRIHRRWIIDIYLGDPTLVLGRPLSAQGRKDVLTNPAIIIELGEEYEEV